MTRCRPCGTGSHLNKIANVGIFAVTAPPSNEKVASAIVATFPDQNIKAWEGHWFVSASGTAREVLERIEAHTEGGNAGTMIVVSVVSFWGRANPEVWEWLASRLESQ